MACPKDLVGKVVEFSYDGEDAPFLEEGEVAASYFFGVENWYSLPFHKEDLKNAGLILYDGEKFKAVVHEYDGTSGVFRYTVGALPGAEERHSEYLIECESERAKRVPEPKDFNDPEQLAQYEDKLRDRFGLWVDNF